MSAGAKGTIYRVRDTSGHDVVLLSETKLDMNSSPGTLGQLRETRSEKIWVAGVDTFWLITGEKQEPKSNIKRPAIKPAPPPHADTALSLINNIKGNPDVGLPSLLHELAGSGAPEPFSFASAVQLQTGYSTVGTRHAETLSALREGKLSIPYKAQVSAIEIRDGVWLVSGFQRDGSGLYRLSQAVDIRSVETVSLENASSAVKLECGLVVFRLTPKWSSPTIADLRSEQDILKSVGDWLSRILSATSQRNGDGTLKQISELLRELESRTVSAEEKRDLEALSGILASRRELLDILPSVLESHPDWQNAREEFQKEEQDRLREELRAKLASETSEVETRLVDLRREVAEAELRVSTATHREARLREESERIERQIEERVAAAAKHLGAQNGEAVADLHAEVERLRSDIGTLEQRISATAAQAPSSEAADVKESPAIRISTREERAELLRQLHEGTGLPASQLAMLIHYSSSGELPVLVGEHAAKAVIDIAHALGGEAAQVIFCDPTKVSYADMARDISDGSGLAVAVGFAQQYPEALVPVALCGLTCGPCEFWLPQLMEMRRIGRLPSNLAFIASAGTDGIRVSVPKSVLSYLAPFLISAAPESMPFAGQSPGFWPAAFEQDPERKKEVVVSLASKVDARTLVQSVAMLARCLTADDPEVDELVKEVLERDKWVAALRSGEDHEFLKHFQNIER